MNLQEYRQSFNTEYHEFIRINNVAANQIHENLRYEKLINVTRIDLPDNRLFFFRDGRLQIIYISGEESVSELWNEIKHSVNIDMPENMVRSRAGKTANQLIFASNGFTASVNKNEVHFIEIYPPCSVDQYMDSIYEEPSPFIR